MKQFYTFLAAIVLSANLWAQSPEKMSYQAVIRDGSNELVTNQQVGIQISILQGSDRGPSVYVETQTATTNINGLVSLEIGSGLIVSGGFSNIDWSNDTYFIKIESDPSGGTNYTISGTSQLMSVPYSLHAKTAANGITDAQSNAITANTAKNSEAPGVSPGDMKYWNGSTWVIIPATQNEEATLQMIGGVPTWTGGTPPPAITSLTGKIWMDRNLGASQVATTSSDAAAYGDLYQWGRAKDGHQMRTSGTTNTLSTTDTPGHGDFIITNSPPFDWRSPRNDDLWQGVNGVNNPCPNGYRLPTAVEWEAEIATWSSNNAAGAFASVLKLTKGGNRYFGNGSFTNAGSFGYYWSSTLVGAAPRKMYFRSDAALLTEGIRAYGNSVRCIKD